MPLKDGVTPPGAVLEADKIKARIDFYGNFVTITNQVQLTVEDRVINHSTRLLAQNFGETIDEVTRDVLASTSSVVQCANGVNQQTPTELTKADTDSVVKSLLGDDAKPITDVIVGRDAYATAPVRPAFYGFIHTDLLDDLEAVSNFQSSSSYANIQTVLDYEWGATSNIRWLYTSIGSKSDSDPIVYNNIIVAKEAYGVVDLRGSTGNFYVEQLGSEGAGDPLHQRGSVGWDHGYVPRILNDSQMRNLQSTHS